MARYINADDLPVTTVAIRPYAISEEPYNAEVVFARFVRTAPTADIREVINSAWIPVSERLPEPRTNCLITTTYGDVELVCFTGKVWWLGEDQSDYWTEQVLAWMPLPESFKH